MNINRTLISAVVVLVVAGAFVTPAHAHRKSRPHHKGLPRRVLVRHSHSPSDSARLVVPTQSQPKKFDLLGGAADIVTGTFKMLGNAFEAVFGGKAEPSNQTEKNESPKDSSASQQ